MSSLHSQKITPGVTDINLVNVEFLLLILMGAHAKTASCGENSSAPVWGSLREVYHARPFLSVPAPDNETRTQAVYIWVFSRIDWPFTGFDTQNLATKPDSRSYRFSLIRVTCLIPVSRRTLSLVKKLFQRQRMKHMKHAKSQSTLRLQAAAFLGYDVQSFTAI